MKVYRKLVFRGSTSALIELGESLRSHPDGWSRDCDQEQRLSGVSTVFIVISTPPDDDIDHASHLYFVSEPNSWRLSNIVTTRRAELDEYEYNGLIDGVLLAIRPEIERLHIAVELGPEEVSVDELFGHEAADALRQFSADSNRTAIVTRPTDLTRWNDFIILSSKVGKTSHLDLLERWLLSEGWNQNDARQLIMNYESGAALVQQYATAHGN